MNGGRAERQYRDASDLVLNALKRTDIAPLLDRAVRAVWAALHEGSDGRDALSAQSLSAAQALVDALAGIPAVAEVWDKASLRLVVGPAVWKAASGNEMGPVGSVRIRTLAGLRRGTVWTVADDIDAEALRRTIAPGQVWVRMDLVKRADKDLVYALAQAQRRELGLSHGQPGRPRRPRSPTDQQRAAWAQYQPGMKPPRVYALLTAAGVYPDDGTYSDPALAKRNKKRVLRFLRKFEAQ